MTGRTKYGKDLKQLMIQSMQHHLWNMVEQWDGMSMHGFQWHSVTGVYWWWSSKVDWTSLHSTNGQWPQTESKSNPGVFEGKQVEYSAMAESISWSQPDWACISLAEDKTKGRKTNKQTNKQQLKSAAVKAWKSITKRKPSLRLVPWVPDLRQSLSAKYSQLNLIYDYICPISFELLKMGDIVVVPKNAMFLFNPWMLKVCTSVSSWLFYFLFYSGGIQSQNCENCVSVQIPMDLTVAIYLNTWHLWWLWSWYIPQTQL